MAKQIDGVVVPERRKSIRNIPISDVRRKSEKAASLDAVKRSSRSAPPQSEEEDIPPVTPPPLQRSRGRGKGRLFTGLIAVLVVAFLALSAFSGATLSYVPRSAPLTFQGDTYSAYKSGTGLLYSIVKLSGDKGMSVTATGETDVSRKASGTIVIYNNASAEAQKLIENTRFESGDGKIYRIQKAVSVPGKTSTGPGSLEVQVLADQAGESYNIGLVDFTLPGLKGSPRFDTIYARSKTAMTGGFVGKEKSVSPDELAKAKADLKNSLNQELLAKASAEVPTEFILFPALSSVTFEDLPQTAGSAAGSVTLNMRGNLYGIMFKKSDLSTALSLGKAPRAPQDPVELDSFNTLEVAFVGGVPGDLLNLSKVDFKVTGTGHLVWQTDEVALKSDLAGRAKSDLPQLLNNYPTIESATASVRPFWKSTFPTEASKITVKQAS